MALSLAIVPTRVLMLLLFLEAAHKRHRKDTQGTMIVESQPELPQWSLKTETPPSCPMIAVVTGGNKGIGLEVEITDASSIARLASFLRNRFGKVDIMVNNAGVVGLEYLHDHIYGVSTNDEKQVIGALLPLLLASDDGRIVNVSSELGQLRLDVPSRSCKVFQSMVEHVQLFGDEALRRELDDVEELSEARVDAVVAAFARDLEAGAAGVAARGWPAGAMSAYEVSKAALNAYSRVLAQRHPTLRINCRGAAPRRRADRRLLAPFV
ncbi:carbonyl reductase 3 [Panicum miliaceum]|uniref:Carbonyl reductase 3 n=1 Tax=Panicum miliaceum TaxID=4540 RepID=A0A3L6TMK8_PANMI|nr:carbonyl reductase 3 [Panicum miliaceum]